MFSPEAMYGIAEAYFSRMSVFIINIGFLVVVNIGKLEVFVYDKLV